MRNKPTRVFSTPRTVLVRALADSVQHTSSPGHQKTRRLSLPDADEFELIQRCLRRIPTAWEEFLARYRPAIERAARGTLIRLIGVAHTDDVGTVVESTLLGLVEKEFAALRAFAGRSTLGGYLQAMASKIAMNHVRGERRKGWLRFRPLEAANDAPAPEESNKDPERVAALRRSLDRLPARDRLILLLFHFDGATYKDIARLLDLSPNAVSPALIRARERLRALLGSER